MTDQDLWTCEQIQQYMKDWPDFFEKKREALANAKLRIEIGNEHCFLSLVVDPPQDRGGNKRGKNNNNNNKKGDMPNFFRFRSPMAPISFPQFGLWGDLGEKYGSTDPLKSRYTCLVYNTNWAIRKRTPEEQQAIAEKFGVPLDVVASEEVITGDALKKAMADRQASTGHTGADHEEVKQGADVVPDVSPFMAEYFQFIDEVWKKFLHEMIKSENFSQLKPFFIQIAINKKMKGVERLQDEQLKKIIPKLFYSPITEKKKQEADDVPVTVESITLEKEVDRSSVPDFKEKECFLALHHKIMKNKRVEKEGSNASSAVGPAVAAASNKPEAGGIPTSSAPALAFTSENAPKTLQEIEKAFPKHDYDRLKFLDARDRCKEFIPNGATMGTRSVVCQSIQPWIHLSNEKKAPKLEFLFDPRIPVWLFNEDFFNRARQKVDGVAIVQKMASKMITPPSAIPRGIKRGHDDSEVTHHGHDANCDDAYKNGSVTKRAYTGSEEPSVAKSGTATFIERQFNIDPAALSDEDAYDN